jgi:type IV pilus assembly protein PilN
MSNINLLPWRADIQAQRAKRLLAGAVGLWMVAALLVFGTYRYVEDLKSVQNVRNSFLRTEISSLEDEIREIESLRKRRDKLISRMQVIQGLQQNRTQLVHILDDLVRLLPEGVQMTSLQLRDTKVALKGRAQSNARVSSLMRAFEASKWFHGPNLQVINVSGSANGRISNFTLNIGKAGLVKKIPN